MIHLFSKRTDSSGFSDEELRAAAQAVRNSMLQSLEETAEPHHTFSESFLRRMRELLRLDQRRNSRRRILQRAAVFLLGVFISGALFLAFNSEARAEFTRWVKSVYEQSIIYQFFNHSSNLTASSDTTIPEITLSGLSNNYEGVEVYNDGTRCLIIFNGIDSSFMVEYWMVDSIDYIQVFSDDYEREGALVRSTPADFYKAIDQSLDNVLVWSSDDGSLMFNLFSSDEKEKMILLASAIKIENSCPEISS